jgi:hypothetical protein
VARGRQAAHASQSADTRYLTVQVQITIMPHVHARGRTAHVSRLPFADAFARTFEPDSTPKTLTNARRPSELTGLRYALGERSMPFRST